MNVFLTTNCSSRCSYCFVNNYTGEIKEFDKERLLQIFNLLSDWGIEEIRLLGGEPTEYPLYVWTTGLCSELFRKTTIFTNGRNAELLNISDHPSFRYCINLTENLVVNCLPREPLIRFMKERHNRVAISFTIHNTDWSTEQILTMLLFMGVKHIRWSLAQPFLEVPPFDRSKADKIFELLSALQMTGFRLEQDCQIPMCFFSDEQVGGLLKYSRSGQALCLGKCTPSLDIWPNEYVSYCTVLYENTKMPLDSFSSISEMFRYFGALQSQISSETTGDCRTCLNWQLRACQGGCLGKCAIC